MFHPTLFSQNVHSRAALLVWCCRLAAEHDADLRQRLISQAGAKDFYVTDTPTVRCIMLACGKCVVCAFHWKEEQRDASAMIQATETTQLVPFNPPLGLMRDSQSSVESYGNLRLPESVHGCVMCLPQINECVRSAGGWILDDLQNFHRNTGVFPGEKCSVLFCGHGIGGAVAQAMTATLMKRLVILQCFTFGSPRVGNQAMVRTVDDAVPGDLYHFVHAGDPLPNLPASDPKNLAMSPYREDAATDFFIPDKLRDNCRFLLNPSFLVRLADEWWARGRRFMHGQSQMDSHSLAVYHRRLRRPLS